MSAAHGTFTITRELLHAPERVYAAWSDPKAKAAWFSAPNDEWTAIRREMAGVDGVTDFSARYLDIVPQRRIVYAYTMHVDEKKISVSLATIVLEPARIAGRAGTRMTVTEQGAFLDGYDDAGSRERGTGSLMDALARSLEG